MASVKLHFTQVISEKNCYQQEEHFVHILGILEGAFLMVSFWLQVEIGHLGPVPGLEKIAVSENPSKAVTQPCPSVDHSVPGETAPLLPLMNLFLSWPQTAFAICPAQAQMCPQLSPIGCL